MHGEQAPTHIEHDKTYQRTRCLTWSENAVTHAFHVTRHGARTLNCVGGVVHRSRAALFPVTVEALQGRSSGSQEYARHRLLRMIGTGEEVLLRYGIYMYLRVHTHIRKR